MSSNADGFSKTLQQASSNCSGSKTPNALRGSGDVGAFLRRDGVYSSQLATWRKQYAAGVRQALSQKRGPKVTKTAATAEVQRLQREHDKLRAQLARAELLIDIQKKSRR